MRSIPCRVIDGRVKYNAESYRRFCEQNEGIWCDLISRKAKRSLSQNNYYWLYITIIADETGNDMDVLHGLFKRKFLPVVSGTIRLKGGEEHTYHKLTSTTDLTKSEFSEYLDKICALTGIPLPDPQAAGYLPK